LGSERFREFLEQVTHAYDAVVLDTAPVLAVADTLELLPNADATLLCVRATQTTHEEIRAVGSALERLPDLQIALLVTGVPHRSEHDFGSYSYAYGS
jgi:Mrp family chromosome partitioning ATPase